jgi:hypothetical protein
MSAVSQNSDNSTAGEKAEIIEVDQIKKEPTPETLQWRTKMESTISPNGRGG